MIRCVNCNISILRKEEIEYMKCRNCSKKWNSIGGIRVKNYIEMFFKDGNFKINTKYIVKNYKGHDIFVGFTKDYSIMIYAEESCEAYDWLPCNSDLTTKILTGVHKIEKIKPKTLMEQLKAQGFGWCVYATGRIECKYFEWSEFEYLTYQGNISLTKSEAEREVYRRKLEFEMKEWARENECLGGNDCLNAFEQVFKGLNVYVEKEFVQEMRSEFGCKYDVWVNYLL